MQRVFLIALLILVTFNAAEARQDLPVFVVQGGFRSCRDLEPTDKFPLGTKQNEIFQAFKDRIEKELGSPLHWVLGCMGGGPFSDDAPMEYVSSSDRDSIGKRSLDLRTSRRSRDFAKQSKPRWRQPAPNLST